MGLLLLLLFLLAFAAFVSRGGLYVPLKQPCVVVPCVSFSSRLVSHGFLFSGALVFWVPGLLVSSLALSQEQEQLLIVSVGVLPPCGVFTWKGVLVFQFSGLLVSDSLVVWFSDVWVSVPLLSVLDVGGGQSKT